jgi:hypothetical protein
MAFRLTVDLPRWTAHLDAFATRTPGLVPVIKGNGYGVGRARLATQCRRLGADVVAVGLPGEVDDVRSQYGGDILVLQPLVPGEAAAAARKAAERGGNRVPPIRTVGRLDVLAEVADLHHNGAPGAPRFVLELDSPMHRHGIGWYHLGEVADLLTGLPCEGVALHLPLVGDRLGAARSALEAIRSAGVKPPALWLSHLPDADLPRLAGVAPDIAIRPRIGTALWLGDRGALQASGDVVDVHPVDRGERFGYRQRRASRGGAIVVVSGGTAHGVGLRSPSAGGSAKQKLRDLATGLAHGAGLSPSPFHWQGGRLAFADPPHMQVSMLFVPHGITPPQPGDRLTCDVRMTISQFDAVDVEVTLPAEAQQSVGSDG